MKLSTLLLSSAAFVFAGSAFAADLPAKKGAPAAKAATGCPTFGAGYFQIPGGDSCIKFSGYVAYEGSYANGTGYTQDGFFRLETTVMQNTDAGALKAFGAIDVLGDSKTSGGSDGSGVSARRAYVQLGGLTAGYYGSVADIAGTNAYQFGSYLGGGTGKGLSYSVPVGASSLTVALENAVLDGTGNTNYSNRPDIIAKFSTSAAGLSADLVGVSHSPGQSGSTAQGNGYALLGAIGGKFGNAGFRLFGGGSQGAMAYTGSLPSSTGSYDFTGSDYSKGTNVGGELSFSTGPAAVYLDYVTTSLTPAAGSATQTNYAGIAGKISVGKLDFKPEFINASGSTNSNTFYLFIERDF